MTLEAKLAEELKNAMRARDQGRLDCIRQVRAKLQEAVNAQDFKGKQDDALVQNVIASYVRMLRKGMGELVSAGERGDPLRVKYQAEIDYLQQYLPKLKDEAETRSLVEAAIAETGASAPNLAGKVVGTVMKAHKGEVDAALVRRLAEELLSR